MQKLQLSEEQRNLLTKHYGKIRSLILVNIKKMNGSYAYQNVSKSPLANNVVDEALGYAPIILAREYDPSKVREEFFPNYIADICCKRMIDNYRKFYKTNILINKLDREFDKRPTEQMEEKIGKYKNHRNKIIKHGKCFALENYDVEHNDFYEIDMSDFIENIKNNRSISNIHKLVLLDYLIPKCFKKEYKDLQTLALENGCSVAKLINIIKSDKTKEICKDLI